MRSSARTRCLNGIGGESLNGYTAVPILCSGLSYGMNIALSRNSIVGQLLYGHMGSHGDTTITILPAPIAATRGPKYVPK